MFNPKNLFRSKGEDREIVSLHLETPSRPLNPGQGVSEAPPQGVTPDKAAASKKAAGDEIGRRAGELMKAGRFPAMYFFGADALTGSVVVAKGNEQVRKSLLLFTSPLLARDFLRIAGNPSGVAGFSMDHFPLWQRRWKALGIDSLCINRCPRCTQHAVFGVKDGLVTKEALAHAWAVSWATRSWRGEALVRQLIALKGDDSVQKSRAILETLRDHVDSGIPYVHWLIALMAGMQGDEEERAAAASRLREFGPAFAGKLTERGDSAGNKRWAEAFSEAHVGLLANFGMLKLKDPPQASPGV